MVAGGLMYDGDDSSKLEDVLWGYFEREEEGQARCVVCHDSMGDSRDELNRHMEENHPKLIGHASLDTEQASEASSNAEDDNTFTEVIYLEQDTLQEIEPRISIDKPRRTHETPKIKAKFAQKPPKKRLRDSTSSDDYPTRKKERPDEKEDDELTIFLKYIKCLLQKLSKDSFNKVQLDIVNLIMTAQSSGSSSYVDLQKGTDTNVISLNDVTGIQSGHNYSITVAACTSKIDDADNRQTS